MSADTQLRQYSEYPTLIETTMKKKQEFNPYNTRVYRPFKIEDVATRPGSLNVLRQPSRIGNVLYYPDGRIVKCSK